MKAVPLLSSNEAGNIDGSPNNSDHSPILDASKFPTSGSHRVSFSYPKGYFSQNPSGLENLIGTLVVPYQVTVKDKMRYHSITMMKVDQVIGVNMFNKMDDI